MVGAIGGLTSVQPDRSLAEIQIGEQRMNTFNQRVSTVRSESDRIGQYLSTLSAASLDHPSACEGWRVCDVVAHLTWAVDMYAGNITRGAKGDSSPTEGMPPAGGGDQTARLRLNAQRAIDLRDQLGDQLLSAFSSKCGELDQVLAELGPDDREKPCYHPAAVIPMRTYVDLRLTELSVHEWDLRSRLEPSAHISAESMPAVIDLVPMFVVGRLFQPGSRLTKTGRYRFEMTGAGAGTLDIVVEGGKARSEPTGSTAADVTFQCEAETFALVAYGRTSMDAAIRDGLVAVQGARDLAAQFD